MSKIELPFAEISNDLESFQPGNMIARMIDGLGYRYYWATEGLVQSDLDFRPCTTAKTTIETLQHIYSLSETVFLVSEKKPNIRPYEKIDLSFDHLRSDTLKNLQKARLNFLNVGVDDIGEFKVDFIFPDKEISYPFWNFLNGQLMDAIYHVGQVVLMRRASGNPIDSSVRVFLCKNQ